MPYTIRKSSTKSGGFDILKKLPGGRTQKVGHSKTRKDAEASVRARYMGERRKKRR